MTRTIRLRVSVAGLFIHPATLPEVLLLHQMTPPEPDCWDLPGGGLDPSESLLDGLMREVREETGLTTFTVDKLLTVAEGFFPEEDGKLLHTITVIYQCSMEPKPIRLSSSDPEVGPKGIQWIPVTALSPDQCSTRSWRALQAANLVTFKSPHRGI